MKRRTPRQGPRVPSREALSVEDLTDEELAAIASAEVPAPRKGGMLRDKLWAAEDFDAPDPDIEKLFYEGDEP